MLQLTAITNQPTTLCQQHMFTSVTGNIHQLSINFGIFTARPHCLSALLAMQSAVIAITYLSACIPSHSDVF